MQYILNTITSSPILSGVLCLVWVLAAMLTMKLDAVMTPSPTRYGQNFSIAICLWPLLAGLLLTSKHMSSNVTRRYTY